MRSGIYNIFFKQKLDFEKNIISNFCEEIASHF